MISKGPRILGSWGRWLRLCCCHSISGIKYLISFLNALESDCDQNDERSSSPIFYERPGLSELDDDIQDSETCTRRVKFSTAPIRV